MENLSWKEAAKKPKKLLSKVTDTIKNHRKIASDLYREVGMGEAFYAGKQYGEWDDKALSWRDEDITDDSGPRLVSNQIKVYTDQAVAKITRYKPNIMTTPESNHEKDVRGSKVAEEMMQHTFREYNFTDLEERYVRQAAITGCGWMKVDWNPFLSDKIDLADEDIAENVNIKVEQLFKGDIDYYLPKSINMIWDMSSCLWKDVKWCVEVQYIDPDTLISRFPEHEEKIRAQIKKSDKDYDGYGEEDVNKTLVKCWRLYHKPCPEFEEGCEAFGIDTKVLELDPFPFEHGRLPYIPLPYTTDLDHLFGKGVPQTMFELQVEYNKIKNVRIDNQNYAAAIKFLNPEGSNYDATEMTNLPGEIVDYAGEVKPEWSQPQVVSQELNDSLDRIKAEMQDVSYVGATSQGKPPEGIRSGIAIQYLIENDDLNFSGIIRRKEEAILEICYQTLSLMKQYYKDEDQRFFKVIGDNKHYQLKKFKQTDLDGKYDIVVQNSNANPLSKAYKMDTIMQLVQYQILGEQDRGFIGESLEIGNLKGVFEDLEADRVRALKEVDDIISGKPHEIMKYDDDQTHIATKVRYLKSEYDKLSPEQRNAIQMAIQQHEQAQAQKQPPMPPQGGAPMPPEAVAPMGGQPV